ncbi:MAG: hypothetical protein EZS28_031278 [Streblomastix strix]|uniref:Uncharacterized protein n=1 Tax=Streblomastix strix TaxID=222440 RepID=A0A5J4UTZ7_9EUKA|nr:MAG: hypothetical protein EZS28_031278 [Streblomastix strix]
MSAVDGGRAFRCAIVVAELMNTALDYSRYQMFEVLMVDEDGGTEVDGVYEEATGVRYALINELNQDAHQDSQHLGMDRDMHQGMIQRGIMDDGTYGYSTAQYQMLGQPGFDRQTQGLKFDMIIKEFNRRCDK